MKTLLLLSSLCLFFACNKATESSAQKATSASFVNSSSYSTQSCSNFPVTRCKIEYGIGDLTPICGENNQVISTSCVAKQCENGFKVDPYKNICVPAGTCIAYQNQSCPVDNGIGLRNIQCSDTGQTISITCQVQSCNNGYHNVNNQCELAPRTYPSIAQAWGNVEGFPAPLSKAAKYALHDLVFVGVGGLGLKWKVGPEQPYQGLSTTLVDINDDPNLTYAKNLRAEILALNPQNKVLFEVRYRGAQNTSVNGQATYDFYPGDSHFWLRDSSGNTIPAWGTDYNGDGIIEPHETTSTLIDFTKPEVQDAVVAQIVALKNSGVADGIMFDWWHEEGNLRPFIPTWGPLIFGVQPELEARLAILRKVRKAVGDDFLIIGNANYRKVPAFAKEQNGIFMECHKKQDEYYTQEEILKMEETLLWAEKNMRKPRINILEGWRNVDKNELPSERIANRQNEKAKQTMRMITTLSLTFSDGYSLFADPNQLVEPDHIHAWYSFYNHDLGVPVGKKGNMIRGKEGLFVREFSKGYAVYNRGQSIDAPGNHTITFNENVRSVTTGIYDKTHVISGRDGDIYLKQ